jgi:hypothetical protein
MPKDGLAWILIKEDEGSKAAPPQPSLIPKEIVSRLGHFGEQPGNNCLTTKRHVAAKCC